MGTSFWKPGASAPSSPGGFVSRTPVGALGAAAARLSFFLAVVLFAASEGLAQPAPSAVLQQLLQQAEANEPVRVIIGVGLDTPFRTEGELRDSALAQAQRERIAAAQERLSAAIAAVGARVHRRFSYVPHLAAEVDSLALRWLMNSPLVTTIDEDRLNDPLLAESGPLIGAPGAWDVGLTGAGWHVAVLDTGVDKTHPFLAGKVVSEACYSSNSSSTQSLCPGGVTASTSPGSGANCTTPADTCGHGTHVAGIATGLNAAGGFSGVAKNAGLIAVQVFSYRPSNGSLGAFDSDIIQGLERVYALRSAFNIASVNMSLGGGRYTGACDTTNTAMKAAIDNLRSAGIAVVVASGNNSYNNAMSYPACISSVVSVGASCDAGPDTNRCQTGIDGVAGYSNIAAGVTLLAPGSYITSALPGSGYAAWSGTSMATPHVAGAWALLKQQAPALTVADGIALLRNNAATVDDTRSTGVVTGLKLIDLDFLSGQTEYELTVVKAGTGSGTVTSNPVRINCGSTCTASFDAGASVTLTASASGGSTFAGWSGACSGIGPCTVSMTEARSVTATFNATGQILSVGKSGSGGGTVTSTPAGINCGSTCSAGFNSGATVTLSTSAASGSVFAGWSGDCTGTGSCMLSMTQARSVTAAFNRISYNLTVTRAGSGSGTVASNPAGIDCGSSCSAGYYSGTSVSLTATAAPGSRFAGWSGACTGTGSCTVNMSQARNVTATFSLIAYNLLVTRGGSGSGTVTSNPAGISCGSSCTAPFNAGTTVTLSAAPAAGSTFVGWSGACTGSGNCTIGMTQTRNVTATFNLMHHPLTVSRGGNGSGTVSSSPAGIDCGSSCSATFAHGTVVTLAATAAADSAFVGWSGACSGSGACSLAMSAAAAVTAIFDRLPDTTPDPFVFAAKTGVAVGAIVTSDSVAPVGYDSPAPVSVTDGTYSIGCTGTFTSVAGIISPGENICLRQAASAVPGDTTTTTLTIGGVAATFSSTTATGTVHELAVTRTGTGSGTIGSDPAGIDCGGTCTAGYGADATVTLEAIAAVESTFAGWSGDCSGTGACTLAMTEARGVAARFDNTPGTARKAAALYVAFFARAADFDGLDFWKSSALASELSDLQLMRSMADGFAAHPDFVASYAGLGDSDFVDAIYLNIGGKAADAAGRSYWLGRLGAGTTRAAFVAEFVFGLLEITAQALQDLVDRGELTEAERDDALDRKRRMENRIEVAIVFLEALGEATNLAPTTDPLEPSSLSADPAFRASQNILRQVTEDPATMAAPLDYLAGTPTIDGISTLFGP